MYGFWQGSLSGPTFGKNANLYPEFYNNTCALKSSYVLDYPKEVYGIIIPAVTNTTACINGWFSGWKDWCSSHT